MSNTKLCERCGAEFDLGGRSYAPRFCPSGQGCRTPERIAQRRRRKRTGRKSRTCEECGNDFCRVDGRAVKTCSVECGNRLRNRKKRENRKARGLSKVPPRTPDRPWGPLTKSQIWARLEAAQESLKDAKNYHTQALQGRLRGVVRSNDALREDNAGLRAEVKRLRYDLRGIQREREAGFTIRTEVVRIIAPWEEHVVWHGGRRAAVRKGVRGIPCVYTVSLPSGVLYVGRSTRVSERMGQHFTKDHPEWADEEPWTIRIVYAASVQEAALLEERLSRDTWDSNANKDHIYHTGFDVSVPAIGVG